MSAQEHILSATRIRSDFFKVRAFDPDRQLFCLQDNIGFGFLLAPVAGAGDLLRDKLLVALNTPFPAGTVLGISRFASPDVQTFLQDFQARRRHQSDPELQRATRRRVRFLREGGVSGHQLPTARSSRIVITVQLPPGSGLNDADFDVASELRIAFGESLRAAQLDAQVLDADGYIRFMNVLLNHGAQATWRGELVSRHDDTRPISEQLLDADTHIDLDSPYEIGLGDAATVCLLHPKRLPEDMPFGSALRYLCDTQSGLRGIREPCLITCNLVYEDHDTRAATLHADELYAASQADKGISRYFPENRERLASIRLMNQSLSQGDRIVRCCLGIAVFGRDPKEARSAAINAQSYWRELGIHLMQDGFALGPLFQNLLPLCADSRASLFLKRYRTMTTRHALSFAPLLGSWRGSGSPTLSLLARDGELMGVCPFDSRSGKNFYVAAKTGAGKSFFANELIQNLRMQDAIVHVIDAGRSYQNLAEQLGGAFIDFAPDRPIGLNPFGLVRDWRDEEDMVVAIFEAMATRKNGLGDFQRAALRRVLAVAFAELGAACSVDAIVDTLARSTDPRIHDLATQLHPFTTGGAFGAYFNGPNTLDLRNPFSVYEVQALEHRDTLQRVVLLQLMYQINGAIHQGDVGRRKLLLIDEAWAMIARPEMASFILAFYRRIRKHGGSVGIITQSVADLYEGASSGELTGGRVIAENSASIYLLAQKAESITAAVQSGRLPLADWQVSLLRSVHTEPGVYSEVFCATEFGSGIGRLVVSPEDALLYSTRPEDRAALNEARQRGAGLSEAIDSVLRQRRQGTPP